MRKLKLALIVTGMLFALIQFFRPAQNKAEGPFPRDFAKVYDVPPKVQALLTAACYDCHGNDTHYPWYAAIQPVAWYLDHHVREGKKELNFHEYGSYSVKRQRTKLKRIREQIEGGTMPLKSYSLLHDSANLSAADKEMILDWLDEKIDAPTQQH